jgi:hypothetical protein
MPLVIWRAPDWSPRVVPSRQQGSAHHLKFDTSPGPKDTVQYCTMLHAQDAAGWNRSCASMGAQVVFCHRLSMEQYGSEHAHFAPDALFPNLP